MSAPVTTRATAPAVTRETSLSPFEEVLDLIGGATAALLPLILLSVPGILLFFVLPLLLLAIPVLAIALVTLPPILLFRLLRRVWRRPSRPERAPVRAPLPE